MEMICFGLTYRYKNSLTGTNKLFTIFNKDDEIYNSAIHFEELVKSDRETMFIFVP